MTRWILGALLVFASSLAQGTTIQPFLHTVINNGDGTFDAVFGTLNTNATAQTISFGASNFFTPGPAFRGQPTIIAAGQTDSAVTVLFDGTPLTWSLGGVAVTADSTGDIADPGALVPLLDSVFDHHDGTFAALFGYRLNAGDTVVPFGVHNLFLPAPSVRGQPIGFQSGIHHGVFEVLFDGDDLTWTLLGPDGVSRSVTASADSVPSVPEPATLTLVVVGLAVLRRSLYRRVGSLNR